MGRPLSSGSWGRLAFAGAARTAVADWRFEALPEADEGDSLLARGWGRSYGDVCINSGASHLDTTRLDRFIAFDAQTGILRCEAGLTLAQILEVVVPRGWFVPVLPGTRFVTLGGAIGNDVHGKNHRHAGSFGCHVRSLTLLRSDGERYRCDSEHNAELFAATIGGLGLTGLVLDAEIQLLAIDSAHVECEDLLFSSVADFARLYEESSDWTYTVSWIDCSARGGSVGRGIFSRARHAAGGDRDPGNSAPRLAVPFTPPVSLVNRFTVDVFNRAYYTAGRRRGGVRREHFQRFFFPLDGIDGMNRIYGRNGFYQYQCVVPFGGGVAAVEELLRRIAASGEASFLAVLKAFGERASPGLLSFPRPGWTLALDFPNRGAKTLQLLASFDAVVRDAGGAVYPAKDARMPADMFAGGYPQLERFRPQVDPAFSSAFWRRVQA